ncbi:MAG TPA: copper homeostasis protein CutC [Agrococcus sp.]|nr:copper homeostasis protein CutC [Agrococcus sp.]
MTTLEIAVQDIAGVRTALAAGAHRLELCQALALGGLTPSSALIGAAVAAAPAGAVRVLMRPRPGGFVLDADELAITCADARRAMDAGAGAIVAGALTESGAIDLRAVEALLEASAGSLVFHRAIDACADPVGGAAALAEAGVPELLTSGGAARAVDGIGTIGEIAVGSPQLAVIAGGGVRPVDIPQLIAAGARAVHLSARVAREDALAGPGGGPSSVDRTDAAIVRAAAAALAAA